MDGSTRPMISVAGIRGTVGDSLVPEEFVKFTAAFCSTLDGRTVVVGADTRPSGPMVRHLVLGACMASGCTVQDLGVVPTPTVGFMVRHLGADGGIAITASHNPLEWNALKFMSRDGTFLSAGRMDTVLERYRRAAFNYQGYSSLGRLESVSDPVAPHRDRVLKVVDCERIRGARFNVVLDLCNGAGASLLPGLLERMGCEVTAIFADPARAFEREAEPLPHNLRRLGETVRETGADLGFAVDPDADRLALVDETGRAIGEERTLTLCARSVLARVPEPTPLVANLSTTRALDDVAREFGTHVERTRIGEAHVVRRLLSLGAVIGGEGNGGVVYPRVHPGRDAATGIALILDAMARDGASLSALNGAVPDYVMVKRKAGIEGRDLDVVYEDLRKAFAGAEIDELDGLKIMLADSWVHVRPSGTEPIVRVIAEAPTRVAADRLAARALGLLE